MELFGRSRRLGNWVLVLVTLLVNYEVFFGCEGCLEQERTTLIKIRDSINHPDGHGLTWGREGDCPGHRLLACKMFVDVQDCCTWPGIFCSTEGRVTAIYISNKREARLGQWHPDAGLFADLEKLSSLTLDGNQISSWDFPQASPPFKSLETLNLENNQLNESKHDLSWLCMLTGLKSLNLGKNQLNSIPPCIEHLSSLTVLRLRGNQFSTSLDIQGLCKLPKVEVLDLHSNQLLDGSIPPCLTNLTQLSYLDLSNNRFGGEVPLNILRNLISLENIYLSKSRFKGVFPFSIWANHVNLSVLDLSSNHQLQVETELPRWVPSFQLIYLNLSNCILNSHSGAIPKFLATQNNLQVIDLSFTKLRGPIPSWLLGTTNNTEHVDLRNNLLSGGFPISSSSSMIRAIYLSNNNISGPLPPNISSLFPHLVNFSMSNNAIEGNILTNHFSNMSFLSLLDLSNNKLTGDVPYTLFTECPSLEFLKLDNNRLDGIIEPLDSRTYFTSLLRVLDISGNSLHGSFNTWIVSLPNLEVLTMHNNNFEGSIPNEMCKLLNMRILDLSHNNLSGSIPKCLININPWMENQMERQNSSIDGPDMELTMEGRTEGMGDEMDYKNSSLDGFHMELTTKGRTYSFSGVPLSKITTIDLSKNALNGVIPLEMGFLTGLHSLNLSYNNLRGDIPTTFQELHELESLDLSYNQLNGSIPPELGQLDRLAFLSLVSNNLTGKIPQSPHFDTFDKQCYTGNPLLCGKPLEDCILHPTQGAEKNIEEEGFDVSFIECFMVSYAIGFWGFIAPIIFKKEWRQVYFKKIDSYFYF
ncbi:hypothetical protein MRB53_009179 [Persea americana]|uniref:Uncharacterized protein n=1 Tax=Persea americana TaxID=3435 RepID=A0ACC2LNE9_PERAE|nr:hypothetical protein MRB53_009179 [Persea americana]